MDPARLIYMANQIARNLSAHGQAKAAAATAQHITLFWEPRMTAQILAADRAGLDPAARAAIEQLAHGTAPPTGPQAAPGEDG